MFGRYTAPPPPSSQGGEYACMTAVPAESSRIPRGNAEVVLSFQIVKWPRFRNKSSSSHEQQNLAACVYTPCVPLLLKKGSLTKIESLFPQDLRHCRQDEMARVVSCLDSVVTPNPAFPHHKGGRSSGLGSHTGC